MLLYEHSSTKTILMLILTSKSSPHLSKREILVLTKPGETVTEVELGELMYEVYSKKVLPAEYSQKGYTKAELFQCNQCIIKGCDEASNFRKVVNLNEVEAVAKDIWNNPDKYSDYKKGSEASYYHFLKYLDIEYPDGTEKRLADVLNK